MCQAFKARLGLKAYVKPSFARAQLGMKGRIRARLGLGSKLKFWAWYTLVENYSLTYINFYISIYKASLNLSWPGGADLPPPLGFFYRIFFLGYFSFTKPTLKFFFFMYYTLWQTFKILVFNQISKRINWRANLPPPQAFI